MGERIEYWGEKLHLLHILRMADGIFYNDLREPFIGADITAVTLATHREGALSGVELPGARRPVLQPHRQGAAHPALRPHDHGGDAG
jgi:hypothetical protein